MNQTKNNSTTTDNNTGFGFGSGIAFGVVMGLVGYFMVSSGKGKKLLGYINEIATQPNLDHTPKNSGDSATKTAKAAEADTVVNAEVAQVKSMLSQLSSRFQKLSEKQKKPPYTNE
jgi:tRNA(Phe) wybutosine-synthesizing methylase Tyw3